MVHKYSMLDRHFVRLDSFTKNLDMEGFESLSIDTVDYVKHFLKLLVDNNIQLPSIFPISDEEGSGVLLEWANTSRVLSIEFLDNKTYECFILPMGEKKGTHFNGDLKTPLDESKIIFFIMKHI